MLNKWKKGAAALMAGLLLVAGSLTATAEAQGSEENPLVTLSYIKEVFTNAILGQTERKISDAESKYEKRITSLITSFTSELKSLSGAGDLSGTSVFLTVELEKGNMLYASAGCELVPRESVVQLDTLVGAGLTDTTAGSSPASGALLEANHLYISLENGQAILATDDVTLLVRGGYTIS